MRRRQHIPAFLALPLSFSGRPFSLPGGEFSRWAGGGSASAAILAPRCGGDPRDARAASRLSCGGSESEKEPLLGAKGCSTRRASRLRYLGRRPGPPKGLRGPCGGGSVMLASPGVAELEAGRELPGERGLRGAPLRSPAPLSPRGASAAVGRYFSCSRQWRFQAL